MRIAATARDQHCYEEYLAAVLEREVAARNASGRYLAEAGNLVLLGPHYLFRIPFLPEDEEYTKKVTGYADRPIAAWIF